MPAPAADSNERSRVLTTSSEPASSATIAPAPHAVPATHAPFPQVAAPDAAGRSLPAPRSDLVQQVVDRLLEAPHGAGQTTIALDPPDLGKLTVRFQRRGRELTITIRTEAVEALQVLRRELPALEQGLARLGEPVRVQLESAQFEHAGHAGGGPVADGGRGSSSDGGRGTHREARDPSSASNPDGNSHGSSRRGRRTPQHSGGLDVWS